MSLRRIIVQGWRFLPHSYAIVSQFHCLELLGRPGIELFYQDMPWHQSWRSARGLLDADHESAIASIPPPPADLAADVIFRQWFPHDCSPAPRAQRLCVFASGEHGVVPPAYLSGAGSVSEASSQTNLVWVAPSNWSRAALIRSGANPARVFVVPHGVAPEILRPADPDQRAALRRERALDGFVFLHIGAMTANKGLRSLLKCFAATAARHPHVRLILKGLDRVYPSRQMLAQHGASLSPAERQLIEPRLRYLGEALNFRQLATLYQVADAYVAPYRAEGFNMPVMEAAACGLPVICTAGGPTDDFITPDFALRIDSHVQPTEEMGVPAFDLVPSEESLTEHMLRAVQDRGVCDRARFSGPQFIHERFAWSRVVDRLLEVMINDLPNST